MVELLAPGPKITVGRSAQDAFGALGAAALPVGAQVNQTIAANMPPAAVVNVPVPPVTVAPPPAAVVVPPPPPAGPTIAPQWAAQGVTWASLQAQGWTEDVARQHGYIL